MKRTQIQLDEQTFEALRRRAFERGRSMSSVARECLAHSLGTVEAKKPRSIKEFAFIASGRSRQGRLGPVSRRHDEALAETLAKGHGR